MRTSYDMIIAGAGSMGMSAGYYLARQGVSTLLIDAFDPPHSSGSHHGETRLMRHAYTGHEVYTQMALRADRLWKELEETGGEPLLIRSGVLNMGLSGSASLEAKRWRAEEYQLAVETLSPDEIVKRWPGIRLPEAYIGLYETEAGYLLSEACVRAYRQQALASGAVLLPNTPVKHIEISSNGAAVSTEAGRFTADKLILSLGAWFGSVGGLGPLPIRSVRKAVAWFESDEALFDTARFPGFTFGSADGGFYGFPSIGGSGLKIGRHDGGREWRPGEPFEPFGTYEEDEADLRRALAAFMPRAAGRLQKGAVCKYELTPDEHFIIDRHPEHEHVLLAGGFSGHGFKFASAVGELLSDLAVKGRTGYDVSPFALSRFMPV